MGYGLATSKVLQADTPPFSNPVLNHLERCWDEP